MAQHYSDRNRAQDTYALPDIETFEVTQGASGLRYIGEMIVRHDVDIEPGWYWQACFPGCLPDGEASGPFATEAEALEDARDGFDGMEDDGDES